MATFTLDDLTTPLTRTEVQAKLYEVLALLGADTTTWKPGGVVRTMLAGCSVVLAAFSELTARIARSGFLETAEGPWLALVARHVYGVEKLEATYAEGEVTLVNGGGGVYVLDVDDLIVAAPSSGKTYRNTAPVSLGALETVTIPIRAVEAGAASSAAPGAITELSTPLLGVTVSNAAPVVGLDEETDATLRARCLEKLGALSPMGPWDAYASAVRGARLTDGSRVGVTRVRLTRDGYGNVTTYVATDSGAVTGTVGNVATDLGAVDEAIQRYAAPLAITAHTASAVPVLVPVAFKLWMYNTAGLTQAQIAEAIKGRLVRFMSAQPIGGNVVAGDPGKVFHDAIRSAIAATLPQIFHVELTVPATDVVLAASQVPVLGTVAPTLIAQVPPSDGAV